MTIRLANFSGSPFLGWIRVNIDTPPTHHAWMKGMDRFVAAQRTGFDTWAIDVLTSLQPGEVKTLQPYEDPVIDPSFRLGDLPDDPIGYFGIPTIDGMQMQVVSIEPSGAHHAITLRWRQGMFCVDAQLLWAPDRPAWMRGEIMVTCSNPDIPSVTSSPPELRFRCGQAIIFGGIKLPPGAIHDGYSCGFPITLVWPKRLLFPIDYSSAAAFGLMQIGGNAIKSLYHHGNPKFTGNALQWSRNHLPGAMARLSTWDAGPLGVTATSGATGGQEDQVFVGGECMIPDGIGAELVSYFVALGQGRRPCHHLEASGDPLSIVAHPNLRFWDGRAHWHQGVSPDQLGKSRSLTVEDSHNWWGPDVEHWLLNRLYVAARLTGSWSLQRLLEAQARVYLLQWTSEPGISTSQPYAARAIGWEGIGVVHLWKGLANRDLAAAVRLRWIDRLNRVILPSLSHDDIWDIRTDDPRLGQGQWWMPWQQSVGVYGLDLAGEVMSQPAARAAALQGALRVLSDAWTEDQGTWLTSPIRPVGMTDGPPDFAQARAYVHEDCGIPMPATDAPPLFDGSFNLFGMPLAVAVVLRHQPENAVARSIQTQLLRDCGGGHPWIPPEMQR